MKTLIATIAILSSLWLSSAQGLVNFANTPSSRFSTNSVVGGPPTGLMSGAGNYFFALYVAPTNVASVSGLAFEDALWTFTGDYGTNTSLAGRFVGNTTSDPAAVVNSYAIGSTANFVVVGWSANLGHDINQVAAWYANPNTTGWIGESQVATNVILGAGGIPVPNIFYPGTGSSLNTVDGFTFQMIPEPAIAVLAGAGLLLLARKGRRK